MNTLLLILLTFIFSIQLFGQKSIAIINKSDSFLYTVNQLPFNQFSFEPYRCNFDPAVFSQQEMMRMLSEKYKVDVINMPDEVCETPGIVDKKSRAWIKNLQGKYDLVLYIYSCRRSNRKLFGTGNSPLYSSGIIRNAPVLSGSSTFLYTSVTARAIFPKSGVPFFHLKTFEFNTLRTPDNIISKADYEDPASCTFIGEQLKTLISYRLQSFINGLENSEKMKEYNSKNEEEDQ